MRELKRVRRSIRRMAGGLIALAALLVLVSAAQTVAQELLDRTYAKYFPVGNGLSCRMDGLVENHNAVGYAGVVKNESGTTYLNVILIVSAFDASDKLLASMDLAVGPVRANDIVRFESMLSADYYRLAKFSIQLKTATPE